jgi:serine/threonine-protein kinase
MGMTAYSLLSGQSGLDIDPRANVAETIKAIFEKPVVPLRRRVPDIPEQVAAIIERALVKDPAERWQSAAAMRTALLHAA